MGIGKQAKVLSKGQANALAYHVGKRRNGLRNQVIVLLSTKAGLRAKEIASITWQMLTGPDGEIGDQLHLQNIASKGSSGRVIPLNKILKTKLEELRQQQISLGSWLSKSRVIQTERASSTSAQVIINMFQGWYGELGFDGCSSHSGRRTFITNAARKISTVGGSLRDVQALAGHSSLQTTQRYIEGDNEAMKRIVDLV